MIKVLCILVGVTAVVIATEHAQSSQHIHRFDGHEENQPKYEFQYEVKDPHTHDHKSQHEERHDDAVKGYYALHGPDGTERHVHYHADKHTGFHADVQYSTHHVVPEYQQY